MCIWTYVYEPFTIGMLRIYALLKFSLIYSKNNEQIQKISFSKIMSKNLFKKEFCNIPISLPLWCWAFECCWLSKSCAKLLLAFKTKIAPAFQVCYLRTARTFLFATSSFALDFQLSLKHCFLVILKIMILLSIKIYYKWYNNRYRKSTKLGTL